MNKLAIALAIIGVSFAILGITIDIKRRKK